MAEYENLREITTLAETMKEQQAWVVLEVAFILVVLVIMMVIGMCVIAFINQTNENINNLLQYHELKEKEVVHKKSVSI